MACTSTRVLLRSNPTCNMRTGPPSVTLAGSHRKRDPGGGPRLHAIQGLAAVSCRGPAAEVTVVGGGVVGLSCALELARAGHRVRVLTADPVEATTSAVAAAVWFPYRAGPAEAVLRWAAASLTVLADLAGDRSNGVVMRPGTLVDRAPEPDLWWTPAVPGHRPATAAELPPGAPYGTRCTLPVVDMGATCHGC